MAETRSERSGMEAMASLARHGLSLVHGPSQPGIIEKTFGQLLREQASQHPKDLLVASEHQNKSFTYSEMNSRTDDLARGLLEIGVQRGQPVAILMGNEIEYIETFFACTKIGCPIALANYGYTEDEFVSVLRSCKTSALIMIPGFDKYHFRSWLPNIKVNIPSVKNIIMVHGDQGDFKFALPYDKVIERGSRSSIDLIQHGETLIPTDIMNLQFTSGSTGLPKASALTHRGIMNAGRFIGDTMYLKASDRICLPVPLFHSFGLIIGLATVSVHGASIILPSNKFDAKATLACIPKYRCTGLYGVTTMFVTLMSLPDFKNYDCNSLRFAIIAGSAVPEDLMRKVWAGFGITQTHTNWGLTESSSICTMTKDTDSIPKRTVTSGRLFPGFSAKIVDPVTTAAVPRGEQGEIVLRGYGIQKCYYANEKKTIEAHRKSIEDGLIWFHTGDKGYIDADGYFVITGRIKDMIIRGGENIAPLEIEERLTAHPAIAQSSVIGYPDERYGEAVCAFVEQSTSTTDAARPSDEELRAWSILQILAKDSEREVEKA
ncbi:hypothetical protein DV737_g1594, partial [Chaetothyriales sp. CBS 132003]